MSLPIAVEEDEPPVFADWELAFARPETRRASEYWEICRGARPMPEPSDITLRGVKAFVSDIALIEIAAKSDGRRDYVVRLAGERVKHLFGNVARKRLGEFLSPKHERRWRRGFDLVCDAQRKLRVHG